MAKKTSKLADKVQYALSHASEPMKPDQIATELELNQRSVRYALNILFENNLVGKIPDMQDLRTNYYFVKSAIEA